MCRHSPHPHLHDPLLSSPDAIFLQRSRKCYIASILINTHLHRWAVISMDRLDRLVDGIDVNRDSFVTFHRFAVVFCHLPYPLARHAYTNSLFCDKLSDFCQISQWKSLKVTVSTFWSRDWIFQKTYRLLIGSALDRRDFVTIGNKRCV